MRRQHLAWSIFSRHVSRKHDTLLSESSSKDSTNIRTITLTMCLLTTLLTGCPTLEYKVIVVNRGECPLLGIFIGTSNGKAVDWSENLLEEPLLYKQYTYLEPTYTRGHYSLVAVYEVDEYGEQFEEEFELEEGIDSTSLTEEFLTVNALRMNRAPDFSGTWRGLGCNYGVQLLEDEVEQ